MTLAVSRTAVVVATDHELARNAAITMDDLAGEPLITFIPGFALRAIAEDFCRRLNLDPVIAMQSSIDETVSGLVRAKLGYSITTLDRAARDGLVALTTPTRPLDRVLGLVWSSERVLPPSAVRLRQRLIHSFQG